MQDPTFGASSSISFINQVSKRPTTAGAANYLKNGKT
jgi:hypothetical protein